MLEYNRQEYSMPSATTKDYIQKLLQPLDIIINGQRPWDIHIHNEKFYTRVLRHGALGLGESYMDKWWDCEQLDVLFDRILRFKLDTKIKIPFAFKIKLLAANIINFQSRHRAKDVAEKHYDLGNTLFNVMLDKRMIYSCAYWLNASNLDDAQTAKLDLVCRKLQLKPGMRLLDIGCGWGGLAKYAAENYGVSVVGVTISEQQHAYANEYCKGLPVDIRLQDYRDINETFDRIVSIGMFEHVGLKNYSTYMKAVHRSLKDNGLFLLHTIGTNELTPLTNEWTMKYIFPNGVLPDITQIAKPADKLFVMEDWHNFGAYYDLTLMAWQHNFVQHWDQVKSQFDERFYRMWNYYLLSCAGAFRSRYLQLWQIVFSKNGVQGGYTGVR